MTNLTTVDEILDFAIQNEQDAVDLYTGLAEKSEAKAVKADFLHYADEERGHKAKLIRVKEGKKLLDASTAVQDLKIADYTVDVELGENPDYQSVLLFAMKQEKAAFRLYSDLAALAPTADLKELLLGLAQEEAKHKLRFEVEYDNNILTEN
jgi:rubrerythrin